MVGANTLKPAACENVEKHSVVAKTNAPPPPELSACYDGDIFVMVLFHSPIHFLLTDFEGISQPLWASI